MGQFAPSSQAAEARADTAPPPDPSTLQHKAGALTFAVALFAPLIFQGSFNLVFLHGAGKQRNKDTERSYALAFIFGQGSA